MKKILALVSVFSILIIARVGAIGVRTMLLESGGRCGSPLERGGGVCSPRALSVLSPAYGGEHPSATTHPSAPPLKRGKKNAQDKKVAVVSFYAVKQIGYAGKPSPEALMNAAKLADDSAYNIMPILKNFHDQFFKNYADKFPFKLMPEEEVIGNADYSSFIPDGNSVDDILSFKSNLSIPGYKVLPPLKKYDNEKNMLAIFNDSDGLMEVYIDFEIDKKGSGGLALVKVKANATISAFNKKGEKVFSVTESAFSQLSAAEVKGIPFMTPRKVLPLCENAVDELMIVLQQDMPKIAKKAGAKL